jgi:serine/threonine-protein kinase ULK2
MKESEDVTLNASKFYLKANMVVDHPKEIEKNENINNYAYDVVNKKKQGGFNGEMIKRDGTRKKELESTKETLRSQQQEIDKSEKDIIGDEETLREKQIKAFKKNSKYLLHRRNIYVFLASVAEEAMDLGKEINFSDVVGYLLIKKLLQLLSRLKELMERKELKEVKELQFWELFQREKDFKDIQAYVFKEYDVFRVFYESVHSRIKDKVKFFDEETQAILASQNVALTEKVYQRHLREYIRGLYELVRVRQFKSEGEERKPYIHLLRMVDCLNVEEVFQFERNGVIFNFHNYYEEPQRSELDRIKKDLQKKMNVI